MTFGLSRITHARDPAATRKSISAKPSATPKRCGRPRRMPTFAPVAASMMLFGPGVIEVTTAKTTKARISSAVMRGPKIGQ